ncbi:MAG TPA: NF038122 family metalloprotease [Pyrinomonadaceae bacterium]|nr:NF038122 family metalloprotease [Pyrinomonadaceae bacterium]
MTKPRVPTRVSSAKKYSIHFYWSRAALVMVAVAGLAALPFYGFAQSDSAVQNPSYQVSSNGSFVIYQGPNGETVCRDATLAEGSALKSSASSTGFRQINHLKNQTMLASSGSGEVPAGAGLTIVLRASSQLDQNPQAKAAFIAAAAKWEAIIATPITVVIDVDYGPTVFGISFPSSNVLGLTATQELYYVGNYSDIRGRLVSHASSPSESAIYNALPIGSIPTDLGNTSTVFVASPILRALGGISPVASPDTEPYGGAPKIGFNSAFGFDFDPSDGITGNLTDFDAVAVHEIGHVLGIGSEVGVRELNSSQPVAVTVWDLFRFRPATANLNTFGSAQRILSSGGLQVQFNGGPELGLSTGRPDGTGGDGNQASHWRDDLGVSANYIGIMDPSINRNTRETITANDVSVMDSLGYTVVAAPTPTPTPTPSVNTVQFTSSTASVTEGQNSKVDLLVTRTGNTSAAATVDYATSDATASERSDYMATLGTLRFAAGEASKVVSVLIVDDRYGEAPETFNVTLSNPINCTLGSPAAVAVTINSDESVNGPNPLDDATFSSDFFVRQQYYDFFNREPDAGGLAYWKGQIDQCPDLACRDVKRVNVSAAFFLSIEFQETGYLVYKSYQAAFNSGETLRMRQFLADTQEIGRGVVIGQPGAGELLEQNKQRFFSNFVQQASFVAAFPASMSAGQFVDTLNSNTYDPRNPGAGGALTQAQRDALVSQLSSDPTSASLRAQVVRSVAENSLFSTRQSNKAFVLMQYFGYMRRNPNDAPDTDFAGYNFWLDKLNLFNGNFVGAEMVKAFTISIEYNHRFAQ